MNDRLKIKTIHVEYTTKCDSKCVMCDYWKNGQNTTIDNELLYKTISDFVACGIKTVYFTGGECLTEASALFEITRKLKRAFPALKLKLITNGLLLEKYSDSVGEIFSVVIISLDTINRELYKKIRGVDGVDKIKHGINLLKEQFPNTQINIRTLVMDSNIKYLDDIIDFVCLTGLDKISFIAEDVRSRVSFGRNNCTFTEKHYDGSIVSQINDKINEYKIKYKKLLGNVLSRNCKDLEYIRDIYSGVNKRAKCSKAYCSCVIGADNIISPCFFIKGEFKLSTDICLKEIVEGDDYKKMIDNCVMDHFCMNWPCPKLLS